MCPSLALVSHIMSSSMSLSPILQGFRESAAYDYLDQSVVASPPTDAISALKFSPEPDSTRIVVSSWDKNVYLYDLRDENGAVGEGKLLQKFEHRAPVLDVCFGANEDEIYTAGLDWDVRK